jgi:RNA polymerase sigma-70 factor, ECF subfamily
MASRGSAVQDGTMAGSTTASAEIEALVRRAAAGDRSAQAELLVRYRPFIRSAVRARLGRALRGREETVDLEQEVALEVLVSLEDQRWQGRSAFLGWLQRVVSREVIDRARYHGAQMRDVNREVELQEIAAAARSAESQLEASERVIALEKLFDALPPRQAQAVVLMHRGHSLAEIAEVLGCTVEAARKHVARGRAKLVSLGAALT